MNKIQIAVIDYGMGNLHSVASALAHVAPDADIHVTADAQHIADADKVIFPGVGAIRDCMAEIKKRKIDQYLAGVIDSGKPVLAICVGMQALLDSSEENGNVDGLGVLPGQVCDFSKEQSIRAAKNTAQALKVPHMGWNQVEQVQDHPLWHNINNNSRFYFVHSYFVRPSNHQQIIGRSEYGIAFTSVMGEANLFAVQFHPEKSHTDGLQLFKNFIDWNDRF